MSAATKFSVIAFERPSFIVHDECFRFLLGDNAVNSRSLLQTELGNG